MQLTSEQQPIVDYIVNLPKEGSATTHTILVNSIAGSGKTTLLVAIAHAVPHTNGLYLAYNKSIAVEAGHKFPKTTSCSTIHSLAYRAVVKDFNLRVGNFTYRDIKESVTYEHKLLVLDLIKEFCLSSQTSFDDFIKIQELEPGEFIIKMCKNYLELMEKGDIECTHDFYLKFFHLALLNNLVTYDPFDFVMMDEAGDVNEVTLEIFKLLPAHFKVATGDRHQNIYSFNHTINAFEVLKGQATFFNMTKSFRVADSIAQSIESFAKKYLSPDMTFKGVPLNDTLISSRAYISRTNAALVARMIELQQSGTPYCLVRKVDDIYKLPLMVTSFKYQGKILDPMYKHVQEDIDRYYEEILPEARNTQEKVSLFGFLLAEHEHDYPLTAAIKLVQKHGNAAIIAAYHHAKEQEKRQCSGLVLTTAHSVKGLEFDEVAIGNDLNDVIFNIITRIKEQPNYILAEEEINELNLAYVAASRARKTLHNAQFLNW